MQMSEWLGFRRIRAPHARRSACDAPHTYPDWCARLSSLRIPKLPNPANACDPAEVPPLFPVTGWILPRVSARRSHRHGFKKFRTVGAKLPKPPFFRSLLAGRPKKSDCVLPGLSSPPANVAVFFFGGLLRIIPLLFWELRSSIPASTSD